MRSIAPIIAAVAVFACLEPLAGAAQQSPGSAPSRGSGWLPRTSYLNAVGIKFTPAELTTVLSRLTEIDRIFLQVDELANPVGFEIAPKFGGGSVTESVVGYRYDLMVFAPSKKVAGEGTDCVSVTVNYPISRGLNAMNGYRDAAGDFVFEDQRGDPVPGATYVWNRLSPTARSWVDVMFTSGRVSPLEAVTRERFQRAKVAFFETMRSNVSHETAYDRWMADAPTRKADREGLRGTLPSDQAAALMRTLEDAEREASKSLRAADAAERVENARQVAGISRALDRARADLAAMPPDERPTPSWIERRVDLPPGTERPLGDLVPLVPAQTPLAGRVFVAQPDLYKGQRSRVNPRVIQVHLSASLTCNVPAVQRAIWQTYQKLDWAAFVRLVDPDGR